MKTKQLKLNGHLVNAVPFRIRRSATLDYMGNLHANATPEDLRQSYALKNPHRPVSYHPQQCCHNILRLCAYAARTNGLDRYLPLLEKYIEELKNHAFNHASALYVAFPFDFEEHDKKLKAPWYSGLSQGFLLGAWLKLYRTTNDAFYLDQAEQTHKSFLQIRDEPGQEAPWVTFVDEYNYLWFEENPCPEDPQTRVLNGHIFALMGIYSYYLQQSSEASLHLLQAGVETVRHYFDAFRRPGQINRYCLLPNALPDYMPARSILQQEWLYHITGAAVCESQWLAFLSDMTYDEPAYQVLREEQGWHV